MPRHGSYPKDEISQKPRAEVVAMRKAMIVRLRISGVANKPRNVKRVRARSSSFASEPFRLRSLAALRRSFSFSQSEDSGIARLIQRVSRAGRTPIKYISRHASGPVAPMNSHRSEARKNPIPNPHWNSPLPFPRALSGQNSAVMEVPVTHSEPMASPARKRNTAKEIQLQENA